MSPPWLAATVLTGSAVFAAVLGTGVALVFSRLGRHSTFFALVHHHCHRAFTALLVTVALLIALPQAGLQPGLRSGLQHLFTIAAIGAGAWLLTAVLFVAQDLAFAHARVDVRDNRRARRMRTQIAILRRLTAVGVTLIAIAAILMTFARFRTFGASLLASAGVIGIVAGVASQSALTNVFAGVQLAFTDALRIDDVVVVEEEWGRVEQLTLMTVTLHLWDERRLVLPTSYFTLNPFQNWTRTESRVLGSVLLHLDFSVPMDELRAQTYRIVSDSPLWDQRDWAAQVVDSTPSTMVVRVLASAADASSAWDLRCDVREGLLRWLHEEHPESLPRLRASSTELARSGHEVGR